MEEQKLTKPPLSGEKPELYYHLLFDTQYKVRPIAILPFLVIVFVLSLFGNILVVVTTVFSMRLRSLTSIFIFNLALSDLLFTVALMSWIHDNIWNLPLGDSACKAFDFVFLTGFYSSIGFLVLMSVQHYMAVVQPRSGWKKGRWLTHVLVCAWMLSILASLQTVTQTVADPRRGLCVHRSKTALAAVTYKQNGVFVGAFLLMGFCYIRILRTIFKSPPNHRHRTSWLAFLLVATCLMCWAPYNMVNWLYTLPYQRTLSTHNLGNFYYASYMCHLLAFTRSCLNPVIYGLFGLIFRDRVRKLFQRQVTLNSEQTAVGESGSGSAVDLSNE